MTMTVLPVDLLTESKIEGTGVFDALMRANKAHLEQEFQRGRIKGTEYSTVYLGSLAPVLQAALEFFAQSYKLPLEQQLLEQQVLLAQNQVLKTQEELALTRAQTALIEQQTLNAVKEGDNLVKQGCKLDAEFDVLQSQVAKVAAETTLLGQKTNTEKAQTTALGVDADSVIGRQKALYKAQTDGFTRQAEQQAAKVLTDAWGVQRTTDEGISANDTNKLNDASVGRAITKLLDGVGA